MKLSTKSTYGLRACYILARAYGEKCVPCSEIEKSLNVSGKYLEQIMRKLSSANLVGATRGALGGYYLVKSPSEITVGDVIRPLENGIEIVKCVGTNNECKCCPTSKVWKTLYAKINDALDGITLQQMVNGDL